MLVRAISILLLYSVNDYGVVWRKKLRWHVLGTDKLIDTIRILNATRDNIVDHYEKTCSVYY